MRHLKLRRDERGATAIEFALTAPLFFAFVFGIIEGGLLLWTQLGLQHGAEMAARCAAVNKTMCNTNNAVQNFAAQNSYGLNPAPSTFTLTAAACGTQISATYTFNFIVTYFGTPQLGLTAQSCFPS